MEYSGAEHGEMHDDRAAGRSESKNGEIEECVLYDRDLCMLHERGVPSG